MGSYTPGLVYSEGLVLSFSPFGSYTLSVLLWGSLSPKGRDLRELPFRLFIRVTSGYGSLRIAR